MSEETTETTAELGTYINHDANSALNELDKRNDPVESEETETSPEEEDTETSSEKEVTEEDTEEETEASPEEEDTAQKGRPKKTVPIDALHEEREKRKDLQRALDNTNRQLLEVQQSIKQAQSEKEAGIPPEDEYERKEWERDREISALKKRVATNEQANQQRTQDQERKNLIDRIDLVDKELGEEGYSGFKNFTPLITQELNTLIADDPANRSLDSQEGWKKIYKEIVFPRAKKMFLKQDKNRIFAEKTRLKEKANLSASPGKSAKQKEKKKEEDNFDNYQKERKLESEKRKNDTLW